MTEQEMVEQEALERILDIGERIARSLERIDYGIYHISEALDRAEEADESGI